MIFWSSWHLKMVVSERQQSCCCKNFEEFIKFLLFLQVIKIWFEIVRESSFQTCKMSFYSKTGVKSPNSYNSRVKSARANWSFPSNSNTITCLSRNRGILCLRFQKAGVNSQSWKNMCKSIISLRNRGKNVKTPIYKHRRHQSGFLWQVVYRSQELWSFPVSS